MEQTAVEFLVSKLLENNIFSNEEWELFEQAKEMEKQQIINAYRDGFLSDDIKLSVDYYKQKFNKSITYETKKI